MSIFFSAESSLRTGKSVLLTTIASPDDTEDVTPVRPDGTGFGFFEACNARAGSEEAEVAETCLGWEMPEDKSQYKMRMSKIAN
jgi:hypothetical protein